MEKFVDAIFNIVVVCLGIMTVGLLLTVLALGGYAAVTVVGAL